MQTLIVVEALAVLHVGDHAAGVSRRAASLLDGATVFDADGVGAASLRQDAYRRNG